MKQETKPAWIRLGDDLGEEFLLEDWALTQLAHPSNNSTRMQLSGWLPRGIRVKSSLVAAIVGEHTLHSADLPGKYARILITDVQADTEVQGVGADRLFVKVSWPHEDDDGQAPQGGIRRSDDEPSEEMERRVASLRKRFRQDREIQQLVTQGFIVEALATNVLLRGGVWDIDRVVRFFRDTGFNGTRERAALTLEKAAAAAPDLIVKVDGEHGTWKVNGL